MFLLFNTLSRFIIAFLPKEQVSFNFIAAVIICSDFGAQEYNTFVSILPPSIYHELMRLNAMILVFWMLSFKPVFSLSSFTYIKRRFSSSSLSATRVVPSASVQFSHSVMPDSLRPHESQHPCPSPTPRLHPNQCPLSWWSIQPSHPLSTGVSPALNLFQHQGLFKWVSSSREVAKVLEFQL